MRNIYSGTKSHYLIKTRQKASEVQISGKNKKGLKSMSGLLMSGQRMSVLWLALVSESIASGDFDIYGAM